MKQINRGTLFDIEIANTNFGKMLVVYDDPFMIRTYHGDRWYDGDTTIFEQELGKHTTIHPFTTESGYGILIKYLKVSAAVRVFYYVVYKSTDGIIWNEDMRFSVEHDLGPTVASRTHVIPNVTINDTVHIRALSDNNCSNIDIRKIDGCLLPPNKSSLELVRDANGWREVTESTPSPYFWNTHARHSHGVALDGYFYEPLIRDKNKGNGFGDNPTVTTSLIGGDPDQFAQVVLSKNNDMVVDLVHMNDQLYAITFNGEMFVAGGRRFEKLKVKPFINGEFVVSAKTNGKVCVIQTKFNIYFTDDFKKFHKTHTEVYGRATDKFIILILGFIGERVFACYANGSAYAQIDKPFEVAPTHRRESLQTTSDLKSLERRCSDIPPAVFLYSGKNAPLILEE